MLLGVVIVNKTNHSYTNRIEKRPYNSHRNKHDCRIINEDSYKITGQVNVLLILRELLENEENVDQRDLRDHR